ncbi:hypothetical protein Tco_0760581 [Tanacetum coccineum]
MFEDLQYVQSLEKEVDELESEKAKFSNEYDLLLQECLSKDITFAILCYFDNIDEQIEMLVPSCFVIFDLEPLSLYFDFVFTSEIFKSLSFSLDCLCHLAILCLDQHAHTLHHLERLLTISLDRLDYLEGSS